MNGWMDECIHAWINKWIPQDAWFLFSSWKSGLCYHTHRENQWFSQRWKATLRAIRIKIGSAHFFFFFSSSGVFFSLGSGFIQTEAILLQFDLQRGKGAYKKKKKKNPKGRLHCLGFGHVPQIRQTTRMTVDDIWWLVNLARNTWEHPASCFSKKMEPGWMVLEREKHWIFCLCPPNLFLRNELLMCSIHWWEGW